MQQHDLSPFGIRFTGLDVTNADDGAIVAIEEALADHGVAVIADQPVDDAAFSLFLARFGAPTFTEGETAVEGFANLNVVTNAGRSTPPKSNYHSDTSYVTRPPAITALRPVELPRSGGGTVVVNQYDAADRLPDDLRATIEGRRALHEVTGVSGLGDDAETATWQPLLRRHPVSGRTALYLSTPARMTKIEGMDDAQARDVLDRLFAHSTDDDVPAYHHQWRAGDILLWDNRNTLHRGDHSAVDGTRTLHRGMVEGEVPVLASPGA